LVAAVSTAGAGAGFGPVTLQAAAVEDLVGAVEDLVEDLVGAAEVTLFEGKLFRLVCFLDFDGA
jgi:hypothetical protein